MGYFNTTLVLLKKTETPEVFLLNFHEKLKAIGVILQKSNDEIIVFNDSCSGQEKEPFQLNESLSDIDIIHKMTEWKSLGLLSYRHPNFNFAFTINYLTWDDTFIYGFDIGFYSKEFKTTLDTIKHRDFITQISNVIDYEFIVGDIGNVSEDYIDLKQSLPAIKEIIKNKSFDIDFIKIADKSPE